MLSVGTLESKGQLLVMAEALWSTSPEPPDRRSCRDMLRLPSNVPRTLLHPPSGSSAKPTSSSFEAGSLVFTKGIGLARVVGQCEEGHDRVLVHAVVPRPTAGAAMPIQRCVAPSKLQLVHRRPPRSTNGRDSGTVGSYTPVVILVPETEHFRKLARTHILADDAVLEVGGLGMTTTARQRPLGLAATLSPTHAHPWY